MREQIQVNKVIGFWCEPGNLEAVGQHVNTHSQVSDSENTVTRPTALDGRRRAEDTGVA